MEEVLIPLGAFAMVAAIVIVPRYLRSQEKQKQQETLRAAIEKGQALPPEFLEAISRDMPPAPTPDRDLRRGVVWIGVALATVAFGLLLGGHGGHAVHPLVGMAAFPGFIGVAFVVLGLMARNRP